MGAAGQASVERHHGLPHSSYSWFDLSPTKSPRTQLSPSVSAGVFSKIRVKRLKTARYRKKKKNERDQREYQSQSRKGKSTMLEKILWKSCTVCTLLQLGISGGTAEYRGSTLGQRKCEEKGEAERKYSVLTINPTDYIPLNHLVRTMVFWSARLMISLRKGEAKGLFKGFSLCIPRGKFLITYLIGNNLR